MRREAQAKSNSGVETGVRWRVVLPVAMSILSASLMVLAKQQQPMLRRMGTGWDVPARVINSLMNGPGFYLTSLIPIMPAAAKAALSYDEDRLFGIALFWFLIGLSIDRRDGRQPLDQQHPIAFGVLFTFGALVCGFFGGGLESVVVRDPTVWKQVAEYPLQTESTMKMGLVVWLLLLCWYFARRAFIAARRSLTALA